jgi:deoxyadenosine/deoxycytidine kinase
MPDGRRVPQQPVPRPDARRIVVVGHCASGKTTLVARLQEHGFDAHVCGQEHSAVRDLWRRMNPDVLLALDVDLDTIRNRRSPRWSEQIFLAQQDRLRAAFAAADLVINTAEHDEDDVVDIVTSWLATQNEKAS